MSQSSFKNRVRFCERGVTVIAHHMIDWKKLISNGSKKRKKEFGFNKYNLIFHHLSFKRQHPVRRQGPEGSGLVGRLDCTQTALKKTTTLHRYWQELEF